MRNTVTRKNKAYSVRIFFEKRETLEISHSRTRRESHKVEAVAEAVNPNFIFFRIIGESSRGRSTMKRLIY